MHGCHDEDNAAFLLFLKPKFPGWDYDGGLFKCQSFLMIRGQLISHYWVSFYIPHSHSPPAVLMSSLKITKIYFFRHSGKKSLRKTRKLDEILISKFQSWSEMMQNINFLNQISYNPKHAVLLCFEKKIPCLRISLTNLLNMAILCKCSFLLVWQNCIHADDIVPCSFLIMTLWSLTFTHSATPHHHLQNFHCYVFLSPWVANDLFFFYSYSCVYEKGLSMANFKFRYKNNQLKASNLFYNKFGMIW